MHPQFPEDTDNQWGHDSHDAHNQNQHQHTPGQSFPAQPHPVPHHAIPQPPAQDTQPSYNQPSHHPVHQPVQPATSPFQPADPAPAQQPPVALQPSSTVEQNNVVPTPVVQVLSPRGVEYVMMTVALFTSAIGLAAILVGLVNGQTSMMSLSFPAALMLVGLPIFAALFLRLKKAELREPSLKLDQSKRRSTQATQIISFLIVLITLIATIVAIFAAMSGVNDSLGKSLGSAFFVLIVFGGILAYYWHDEHRA